MAEPIGCIVATHGDLAHALVATTDFILGRASALAPFAFKDGEDPRASSRRLQNLIKKRDSGSGVIIMVDLFGGTPGSLALAMLERAQVEVITGVNLPMTLAAAQLGAHHVLADAGRELVEVGRKGIRDAGLLLQSG